MDINPLLTTGKACEALGIGRTKLMGLIRDGRLAVEMLDGRIRVPTESIEAFRATLHKGYVPSLLKLDPKKNKRTRRAVA
jgi:excisionase family DNA binding protein